MPPPQQDFTGNYGIVLLPDVDTAEMALEFGVILAPEADMSVSTKGAHVTLYGGHFKRLPFLVVSRLLDRLKSFLGTKGGSTELRLGRIAAYEQNPEYLFWLVENEPDHDWKIRMAHATSLGLSPWLNRDMLPRRPKDDTDPHQRNAFHFGHTLVGDQFLPHITLAADPGTFQSFVPKKERRQGAVAGVAFVLYGKWGTIDKVIL